MFLKIQIAENYKNKNFMIINKPFFNQKGYHYKQTTTKTKRRVISNKTTNANILSNYFLSITK